MSLFQRYKILQPMETGPGVSVYACRERSASVERVLTLVPPPWDRQTLEDCFLTRKELVSPFLVRVRDVAYRGKRIGVVSDRIPGEYAAGALGRVLDKKRFAFDLVRLLRWLSQKELFLGVVGPQQLFIRNDGHWVANFLGPRSLFKQESRGREFLSHGAPEYIEGKQENRETDLYSLGLLLYQLFVGQPAFTSQTAIDLAIKQRIARPIEPRRGMPDIPKEIEELILGLLEKDPSARAGFSYSLAVLNPVQARPLPVATRWRGPLVGRERELRVLRECLHSHSKHPRFKVIRICGPSGIGKTRLAQHFEDLARMEGLKTVSVRYMREGRPMPLLEYLVGQTGSTTERRFQDLENEKDSRKYFRGPLIIRAEDLQWVDEADADVYQRLQSLQAPVLVVATVRRSEIEGAWKRLEDWFRLNNELVSVKLGPLDAGAVSDLATLLCPTCSSGERERAVVASGGNPFLLLEALRLRGRSAGSRGQAIPSLTVSRIEKLPENPRLLLNALAVAGQPVRLSLLGRVTKLGRPTVNRAIARLKSLELVSASPADPESPGLEFSHSRYSEWVAEHMETAESRSLSLGFAQAYLIEYDRTGDPSLLDKLTRHFLRSGEPRQALPFVTGAVDQLLKDGLVRRASSLLLEAFRHGVLSVEDWTSITGLVGLLYDCGEHETLASLALDFSEVLPESSVHKRAWLLLCSARAKNLLGDCEGARSICERALGELRGSDGDGLAVRIRTVLMIVQTQLGNYSAADALRRQLEKELLKENQESSAIHSAFAIFMLESEGCLDRAKAHAVRSLYPLAIPGTTMPAFGRVCSLAMCLSVTGDLRNSDKLLTVAMNQARVLANPELASLACLNRSAVLRRAGDAEILGKNLRMLRRGGAPANRNYRAEYYLQVAKFRTRTLDLPQVQESLDNAAGETAWTTRRAEVCRSWLMILGGCMPAALELLSDPDPRNLLIRAQRQMARAQAHLQLGQLARARKEAAEALVTLPDYLIYHRAKAHQQMGLVCLAEERIQEALENFETSLRIAQDQFYYPLMARGYALKGKCLALLGDAKQGRVFGARALQVMTRVERPGLRAEICRILGQILTQLNRHEEARLNFVRALRILREKSLPLANKHRPQFEGLWIEPIERELAHVARSRRSQLSSLQVVERFAARSSTSNSMEELAQEAVQSITSAVAQSSARVGRVFANGRTSIIAEKQAGGSSAPFPIAAETSASDRCSLKETFRVLGVGRFDLRVTSHSGGFAESEYDLIKALVRIMEALRPDWSEPSVENRQMMQEGPLELSDGRLIVGRHPKMLQLFSLIRKIGPTGATVLIHGESGTGKELVARALHDLSSRAPDTWVAVNCAALPADLIESELFGYRKGSFTGAGEDKRGLVEAADGGTLFLDEIASMPLEHQSRLLRVLQEKTIRRLGELSERRVDIRIIAATNQSLNVLVERGEFREDLFHRLNVIPIIIPPLRERASDIPLLATHFLKELELRHGETKEATPGFLERLEGFHFRGNARELQNVVEQAYLLSPEKRLQAVDVNMPTVDRIPVDEKVVSRRSRRLFNELVRGEVDFWDGIRKRFLARDLSRLEVREIISLGLASTDGSYRQLVREFHLPERDYRRFLAFLSHHRCKVDFRLFRHRY